MIRKDYTIFKGWDKNNYNSSGFINYTEEERGEVMSGDTEAEVKAALRKIVMNKDVKGGSYD